MIKQSAISQMLLDISEVVSDGHFTICKFTTNWKVFFGTPNEDSIRDAPAFPTFEEAALIVIAGQIDGLCGKLKKVK